jgi:hypothetical protein
MTKTIQQVVITDFALRQNTAFGKMMCVSLARR